MFEKDEVGLVLGGFVTEFTKKEKLVAADNGLLLKVNDAFMVLPDLVQVTADVSDYGEQLPEAKLISGGKVNWIMSPEII